MRGVFRGVLEILTARERREAAFVVVTIMATGLAETAAVAALAAFLRFLTAPESIRAVPALASGLERFGWQEPRQALIAIGVGVLVVLLLKNSFVAFATWVRVRFIWSKLFSLSSRLLERYLSQPYEYFLTRNSALLSKNFLVDINQVVGDIIRPAMTVLSEGTTALFITAFLFWYDALLAGMVVAVFGGGYALVYWATRRKLTRIGKERLGAHEERFRMAHEALGGIKEVKVFGRESFYLRRYNRASHIFVRHQITENVLAELPRFAVESLAFSGILGIIILTMARQGDFTTVIAVAGLYVAAGYRLMPSLNRISASLAAMRFSEAILEVIHGDLVSLQVDEQLARTPMPLRFEHAIELTGVSYQYPAGDHPAIRHVSLVIRRGNSIGIAGETGSGKSTLADLILGALRPSEGEIRVDDQVLTDDRLRDWRAEIGYIPQHIFLADDTVEQNIAFGIPAAEIDRVAVGDAARLAGIAEFIENELSEAYKTVIGERGIRFSGGQRQRLGIARALYHRPKLLVLDEATSALDSVTESYVNKAISSLHGKVTLIVIAHRFSTIEQCDVIFLMDRGQLIAQGGYESLVSSNDVFQRLALHGAGTPQ